MENNRQLRGENEGKESELTQLKGKFKSLEKQLDDVNSSFKILSAQSTAFEADLLKKNVKVRELETALETMEKALSSFVDHIQNLKDESINSLKGKFKDLENW